MLLLIGQLCLIQRQAPKVENKPKKQHQTTQHGVHRKAPPFQVSFRFRKLLKVLILSSKVCSTFSNLPTKLPQQGLHVLPSSTRFQPPPWPHLHLRPRPSHPWAPLAPCAGGAPGAPGAAPGATGGALGGGVGCGSSTRGR